ncbi:MAG: hypothetical protein IPP96_12345 [Chitinophagaceae bacterium]|nr:hypothetical protein [Chitinophagaceae bacterium]
MVAADILFESGVVFNGEWDFNAPVNKDHCEITGSTGKLSFGFFSGNSIEFVADNKTTRFDFELLQHVQQPMIEKVVQYFLGHAQNPCSAEEGAEIMRWMDEMTKK